MAASVRTDMVSRRTQSWGLSLLALTSMLLVSAQTAVADGNPNNKGVFGYWRSIDKDTGKTQSVMRLWEDKGKLVGRIVKRFPKAGETLPATCTECSGSAKDKPIDGMIFFWGFTRDDGKDTKWVDGKVLNPGDGKTYNCEVELIEGGAKLSVYGYIRLLVKVGGTSVWQRPTAEDMKSIPGA